MADMVRKIQGVTAKPLSIDTPDPAIARAGLEAYDPARAGGRKPILNSITPLRAGMFDLYRSSPSGRSCWFPSTWSTAVEALPHGRGDLRAPPSTWSRPSWPAAPARPTTTASSIPGIAPIGSDSEGNLQRLIGAMELIHADPALPASTPRWA